MIGYERICIVLLAVLLCGCAMNKATVKTVTYDDKISYTKTSPENIKIFKDFPPRDFIKIGEIDVVTESYSEKEKLLRLGVGETRESLEGKMREQAAGMGGDAIVIQEDKALGISSDGNVNVNSYKDPQTGDVYTSGTVSGSHEYGRKVYGVVIKFKN